MNLVLATTVKEWLSDNQELALIDVREHGQYGEAHPFFVSSVPLSRFEWSLPIRVPNPNVRMVLVGNGDSDSVAQQAAQIAQALGYQQVHVLQGGAPAWSAAGYTLYSGVNVPSKTFAEIMEHERHTPAMTAQDVAQLAADGVKHVIVDGRPLTEFRKFSIPGATCCPNGELALRIGDIVTDDDTTIIVNCAGRTRSIVGAQTLIDAGVPNPVFALENGTQGWVLAGLERAHGATEQYPATVSSVASRSEIACERAAKAGVQFVSTHVLGDWLVESARTTYLLDVRTPEEFAENGHALTVHAPGGQLVQGTDEWIGVRGARVVLIDDEKVRAPMTGYWLAQLGHEVYVLDGGVSALAQATLSRAMPFKQLAMPALKDESAQTLDVARVQLIDCRTSMEFRQQHIDGARWSVRPMVQGLALDAAIPVVLIGTEQATALVAKDLENRGIAQISRLTGDAKTWQQAGLSLVSNQDDPADQDCIDHLFFTAQRHTGNAAHSHQYLDWEINLVNQLDQQERAVFTVVP